MTLQHRRTLLIRPVPAPRMSKRDQWRGAQSPAVQRYVRYCEELRFRAIALPQRYKLTFCMRLTDKQIAAGLLAGSPHRERPDKDNLEKGFLDAVFYKRKGQAGDQGVWSGWAEKVWADEYAIVIEEIVEWQEH
jgi:Holliday junction resolvase RusA-like endonuclease